MLNFPDSPVAGTVFGAWRYDGVKWGAVSGVSGGGSAGDITAVLAGAGLSGGGTEGDVSIALAVPVTVARGGTGATDAATALTNLGGAPLASPTFTGDPKAPTPATADNDTSIATTAYVKAQGYQTGNQTITLSGDASGSGTTAITTTLATVNANVGTFQGITVNGKGLVTAAVNQSYLTGPVNLTSEVTGVLPIANGGSGSSTAAGAPWVVRTGDTMTGALTLQPASGDCNLYLQRAAGSQNVIWGRTGSNARWGLALGDGASEAGSNAGSDFIVRRYNDAGTFIDAPLTITRSTGVTTITSTAEINLRPGANPGAVVLQNPGNLVASIGAILKIGFPGGGVQYGISMRPAADSTNMMMFYNAAGTSVGSISQTATATAFNTTSDARLKEDLQSFDAGPIIDATNVYDYAWISTGEREYGVIAQEAIEVYPQAVTHTVIPEGDNWGVDYSKYVPVLLQELKALRERVRVLEGS